MNSKNRAIELLESVQDDATALKVVTGWLVHNRNSVGVMRGDSTVMKFLCSVSAKVSRAQDDALRSLTGQETKELPF